MDLSQEVDDYIRESIDHSLGLPVSTHTLQLKLRASLESQRRLRDQYLHLQAKLKEKDDIIEQARAESSMNAQALKKFVEENQKLATECSNLLGQCTRLEQECSLYDNDREALMDFGNEANERAKEADFRVREFEDELRKVSEELLFYKRQCEMQQEGNAMEQFLLETLVSASIGKEEVVTIAHAFLEANNGVEICQRMQEMWSGLRPLSQKVLALASELKTAQKDKEHLRINLLRAEDEVKLLFEENNILDKENRKLTRRQLRSPGSGGKHISSASKGRNGKKIEM